MNLPLEPLMEAAGTSWRVFREAVGSNTSMLQKAAREGLTPAQADRWAVRLGMHPIEVWGDQWLQITSS